LMICHSNGVHWEDEVLQKREWR